MFELIHVGIPTGESREGEVFSEKKGLYFTPPEASPFAIEYCRYLDNCVFPESMRNVFHVAARVDDIDAYIALADEVIFPKLDNGAFWMAFVKKDGVIFELQQNK